MDNFNNKIVRTKKIIVIETNFFFGHENMKRQARKRMKNNYQSE